MSNESLQDRLDEAENPVDYLRNVDVDSGAIWSYLPDEHTHWIEEQRAWRERCAFMDQSYHMVDQYAEGLRDPDASLAGEEAIDLFSDLGVNSFDDFRSGAPPQAKQLVMCNSDGYVIADCTLFYLEENEFLTVGTAVGQNWIRYNAETGEYDVSIDVADHPMREGSPTDFRFELMGPDAYAILNEVTDDLFEGISFFELDTVSINGHEIYALGHQMSGEKGLELFGPYEHHDEIKKTILEAGAEYEIRQLGSKSYISTGVESAWIPIPLPAIYDQDEMQEYRDWLDAASFESNISIAGSLNSDDISEYYLTPNALNYEHIVKFDHDFVGREAVEETVADPNQTKVTLVWDSKDVIDVHASLFENGETNQFIEFPDMAYSTGDLTRYDEVLCDGGRVGISKYPCYDYNEREMLSLCCIDIEYSQPGTDVTIVWGEEGTEKSRVERHLETEIEATVAPAPYVERERRGE